MPGSASQTETETQPRLYTDLARWWPLVSPPSHYDEEAADLLPSLRSAVDAPPRTLLELGSGGGSLAWHLKRALQLTLTDRSAQMLDVSRAINPECEHIVGDMRSLDLQRTFDLVLIHDAIMYATDAASAQAAIATARRHCRRGGGLVIVPDCVRETFTAATTTGGEDAPDGRGLRYLEWTWDPDPDDNTFEAVFSLVLRERDGSVRCELDQHRCGLFSRATWSKWLGDARFAMTSRTDPWQREIFVCTSTR